MMSVRESGHYGLTLLSGFMDARVKPGHDTALVVGANYEAQFNA